MTKCDEFVLLCAITVTTIKNGAKQTLTLLTLPAVHYTLLFCIELCSVHLVGSAVVEQDLLPEPDDICECEKSLYMMRAK